AIDDLRGGAGIHAIEIYGLTIACNRKKDSSINILETAGSQIATRPLDGLGIRTADDGETSRKLAAVKIKLRARQFSALKIQCLSVQPAVQQYWTEEILATFGGKVGRQDRKSVV